MKKTCTFILFIISLNCTGQGKFFGGISGNRYTDLDSFITGLENENGIKVYPNPANQTLHLCSPINGLIQMLDLKGQVITKFTRNADRLDVSLLPSGTYVLVIEKKRIKFIKQ